MRAMSTEGADKCELCGEPLAGHVCRNPLAKFLGKTIDDRYRVESVLGKGGMGVVFEAVQTSVQRRVAVKMLNPSLADTPSFFERFKREAELASRLHHPNIITIFDFGKTKDGGCYYVMELLEGESLRNVVKRDGPLPLGRAVKIIEQIARALANAHGIGVIHRDLKPHNVMVGDVDGKDHCKVLDFGLVKMMEDDDNKEQEQLTTTGQVLGTPSYMAPEQAAGDPCDQRADLFSLGVCFFYCLAGSPPFKTNSAQKALIFMMSNQTPPVGSMRIGAPIPEALEEFLRRSMAFDASERPDSAEKFIEEMHAALEGVSQDELEAVPEGANAPPDLPGLTPSKVTGGSKRQEAAKRQDGVGTVAGAPKSLGGSQVAKAGSKVGGASNVVVAKDLGAARSSKKGAVIGASAALLLGGAGLMASGLVGARPPPDPQPIAMEKPAPVAPPLAVPVEPAKPQNATLKIETEPAGAQVYRGDTLLGSTPATLILPREAINLTLKLDGYQPRTEGVDLGAAKGSEPMTVKVTLTAEKAKDPVKPTVINTSVKKKGPDIPTFGD